MQHYVTVSREGYVGYPPLGGSSRCKRYVAVRVPLYCNAAAGRHDDVESKILYLARQIRTFEFW